MRCLAHSYRASFFPWGKEKSASPRGKRVGKALLNKPSVVNSDHSSPWVGHGMGLLSVEHSLLIHLQCTHTCMRRRSGGPIRWRSGQSDQQQQKEASDQECRAEIQLAVDCTPAARTRQGVTEKPPNHPINPKEDICDSG